MRRFSQRNPLVTLSDINITPLLDLAFVLLIIFMITTPLLEQSLKLDLPAGGQEKSQVSKNDVRTVEVNPEGGYVIRGQNVTLPELEIMLVREFQTNPDLALYIRADRAERYENVLAILNICEHHGIKRMKFATRPER